MANRDFPSGFKALQNQNGSMPKMEVLPAVAAVVYEGALVFLSGGAIGAVRMFTGSSVLSATALSLQCVGVAAQYKPTADTTLLVYTDPEQIYEIQHSGTHANSNSDCLGQNFAVTGLTLGNATTGRSFTELKEAGTSITTSSDGCIAHVINRKKEIGEAYGTNTKLVVKLNPKWMVRRNNGGA